MRIKICGLLFAVLACSPLEKSRLDVTNVKQTPVKRQAIGNCWLYAAATWLESLLKNTSGQEIDISETYWTYWDLYLKLMEKQPIPAEELNTGGTWARAVQIIREHGWVEEENFIASEKLMTMSEAQLCAEEYILQQGKPGGTLADAKARTPELVRAELDKAFSCGGRLAFDVDGAAARSHKASETMLRDVKTGEAQTLSKVLDSWQQVMSPSYTTWGPFEGKKLGPATEFDGFKQMEQRIKTALNDHQPVLLSFYVSFNAPDASGMFNLNSLADKREIGEGGGHMIVLHDYTVSGAVELGEGDMSPEQKAEAMRGDLEYLVAKNSWGFDRPDRPWLHNGYSRFTWDYFQNRYYDQAAGQFVPFLRSVILPPGY